MRHTAKIIAFGSADGQRTEEQKMLSLFLSRFPVYVENDPAGTMRNIIRIIVGRGFYPFNDRTTVPTTKNVPGFPNGLNMFMSSGYSGVHRGWIQQDGLIDLMSYVNYYEEHMRERPGTKIVTEGNCIEISAACMRMHAHVMREHGKEPIPFEGVYDLTPAEDCGLPKHGFMRLMMDGIPYGLNPTDAGIYFGPQSRGRMPEAYEIIPQEDVWDFLAFYDARIRFEQGDVSESIRRMSAVLERYPRGFVKEYLDMIRARIA